MAEEEFILDLNPTEYTVIPDLSSVMKLDAKNPSAVFFLQAASLHQGKCLTVGVPGFRIVTEQPKIASCPFVLRLNATTLRAGDSGAYGPLKPQSGPSCKDARVPCSPRTPARTHRRTAAGLTGRPIGTLGRFCMCSVRLGPL